MSLGHEMASLDLWTKEREVSIGGRKILRARITLDFYVCSHVRKGGEGLRRDGWNVIVMVVTPTPLGFQSTCR